MTTKVEGKGAPKVEPSPDVEPTSPVDAKPPSVPPSPASEPVTATTKAEAPAAPRSARRSLAPRKRSVTPLLIGALLIAALFLGLAALLSGPGR
jgi:uncharacterized protein HemX